MINVLCALLEYFFKSLSALCLSFSQGCKLISALLDMHAVHAK